MCVYDTLKVCDAINVFCEGTVTCVGTTFTVVRRASEIAQTVGITHGNLAYLSIVFSPPLQGEVSRKPLAVYETEGSGKDYLNSTTTTNLNNNPSVT